MSYPQSDGTPAPSWSQCQPPLPDTAQPWSTGLWQAVKTTALVFTEGWSPAPQTEQPQTVLAEVGLVPGEEETAR